MHHFCSGSSFICTNSNNNCFYLYFLKGTSKHLINHSAITCSVQTDDIVACVLLLYNPITKCPLHIHAYRCDSESTAQALNQQLQVLINRPENQKRFAELEARLVEKKLAFFAFNVWRDMKKNGVCCQQIPATQ